MYKIQEEVLINSFYTWNSISYFFPNFYFYQWDNRLHRWGIHCNYCTLQFTPFFSRVISVVFICLCFKVSNSLQIYEEQRQYANFFA